MKVLLEILYVWAYNKLIGQVKFDPDYNNKVGQWLDENKELTVSKNTATLNGFELWVSNYPYSYGHPWSMNGCSSKRFGLSSKNIVRLELKVREIRKKTLMDKYDFQKINLLEKMERLS
tara:strand:+ start:7965 stop:8321 length:357 start_codon:yes stop_codon:yes gene_type:complete